jgi:hypothetical protein
MLFMYNPKSGSGSLEQDGPLGSGAMKKEKQTDGRSMTTGAGKGPCHADKTGQRLSQRVLPALHVRRFSRLFSHGCRVFLWDHHRRGRPESRFTISSPIPLRNRFLQPLARLAGSDHPRQKRPMLATWSISSRRMREKEELKAPEC